MYLFWNILSLIIAAAAIAYAYVLFKQIMQKDAGDEKMQEIAERYPAKRGSGAAVGAMPYAENVRLGLNVAACDMLPVAVVVTKDEKARTELEKELRALAWSDELIGRVVYASTTERADLEKIEGAAGDAVLLFVQPDPFGLEGKVLAQTAKTDRASLAKALTDGLAKHDPGEKDAADHIRDGRREGVDWETAVPVTDPLPEANPPAACPPPDDAIWCVFGAHSVHGEVLSGRAIARLERAGLSVTSAPTGDLWLEGTLDQIRAGLSMDVSITELAGLCPADRVCSAQLTGRRPRAFTFVTHELTLEQGPCAPSP